MGPARRRAAAAGIAVAAIVGPVAAGQAADDADRSATVQETASPDATEGADEPAVTTPGESGATGIESSTTDEPVDDATAPEPTASPEPTTDPADAGSDLAVDDHAAEDNAAHAEDDEDEVSAADGDGDGDRKGPPPGRPRGHGYGLADRPADARGLARGHAHSSADRPADARGLTRGHVAKGPGKDDPGHSHGRGKAPGHTHGQGHAAGHTHGGGDGHAAEDAPTP